MTVNKPNNRILIRSALTGTEGIISLSWVQSYVVYSNRGFEEPMTRLYFWPLHVSDVSPPFHLGIRHSLIIDTTYLDFDLIYSRNVFAPSQEEELVPLRDKIHSFYTGKSGR